MRAILAVAIIIAASPALAQPKLPPAPQPTERLKQHDPAARACERENAGMEFGSVNELLAKSLHEVQVLIPQKIKEAVHEERAIILEACEEAGAELDFCKRIVMGDMLAQIRAECEADGEDPEVCEETALLPE